MSFNFTVQSGDFIRLKTEGKYCDRDIIVTGEGGGIELPPLDDSVEGQADDLVVGKKLYNDSGEVVNGANPYEKAATDETVGSQATLLDQALAAIANKAAGGGSGGTQLDPIPDDIEGNADDLVTGKKLYNDVGQIVEGANPYKKAETNAAAADQADLIQQIKEELEGKAAGGGGDQDIPSGYKRCDYITFTGSQWVDTGIIGNQDTQINTLFTWTNTTQRHLYGCASSDNTKSITSYMNGSWRFGNKSATKNISQKEPLLPYSALVNKTTISMASSVTAISGVNDFETVGTLLLGGARDVDGTLPGVGIYGRVYYFYLWQGEEMVRKLVPVTDGNGVYRFFDMVSKTFFDSITSTALGGGYL